MVIRIGVARGISHEQIAKYLGRGRVSVSRHISAMRKAGTDGELPMDFVADPIAEAIRNA